ncbi:MAG: Hypothetical protein COG3496 [uncultured Thiotrichaceae bacterium]|uniref:DUF1365 domain-containing protein n=1 Tax=uncultured Thiotrichaceae bacterium TaxID=298394 RepID=A0A6S6U8E2_9GAMM|nr:MAG: Hypothetical protein COG3496 [uncultured Thiotrichaceae bacterium]
MTDAASLYDCDVMHQRHFPVDYRFTYRVFSLLIDIDELELLNKQTLLSVNGFNLFGVYTKDHGDRSGRDWRLWVDHLLDEQNLPEAKGKIQLLCFPRIVGYGFNPLSLWYCQNENDELIAVICEVSNTFGEHHHYVIHNNNEPLALPVKAEKSKVFHVSPFINMQQRYQFTLDKPDELLRVVIQEYEQNKLMLVATQQGERRVLSTGTLLRYFFLMPLMTMKIMIMIHWHALKIWLGGGKFYRKPKPPIKNVS